MNLIKIQEAKFVKSSADINGCPASNLPEMAFVGRSNVGKSSLLNMLTERKTLAKVSGKPGKTRLINHFLIDDKWFMVDLPGYGWAKVSHRETEKWEAMVHDYFSMRKNLTIVFVLVDIRREPMASDLKMIRWLGENNVPLGIVFTKADKLSKNKQMKSFAMYKKELNKEWDELPPYFITSASTGDGKEELLKFIVKNCIQ